MTLSLVKLSVKIYSVLNIEGLFMASGSVFIHFFFFFGCILSKKFAEFERPQIDDSVLLLFAHDIKQKTLVLLASGLMKK